MIYHAPKSSVIMSNISSKPFNLYRGVTKGDCLSALLFNLALEPLAIGIRSHPHINGIFQSIPLECLVTLYADDLVVTVMNPETGIII